VLDKVGWFSEDYFLDGEDIDLSWKIKNLGYKNIYYPRASIIHIKGATKGKNRKVRKQTRRARLKYRLAGVNSMEMFYKKRLWQKYPLIVNLSVLLAIKSLKFIRTIKVFLS
jgi:hypothetical protein